MQINVPNFGFKTGEVAPRPSVGPETFITPGIEEVAQGGLQLGQAGAQIAEHQAQESHIQALQDARIANTAKLIEAGTIQAQAHVALNAAHNDIVNGIQDGTVNKDAAAGLWAKTSESIVNEHLKQVDSAHVARVKEALIAPAGNLGLNIGQAVVSRNQQDIGAGMLGYLEQMKQLGLEDIAAAKNQGTMVIESYGPKSNFKPEALQKIKQDFVEGLTFNTANSFVTKNQNDPKALNQFLNALPQTPDLQPDKQNILQGKAMSYLARIEARGARAEASRLQTLQYQVNAVDSMLLKGYEPDAGTMVQLTAAAKGTPYEQTVKQQIEFSKQTAQFRAETPIQQEQFINTLEAQVREKPTPEGIQTVDRMKAIYKAQGEQIQADPMTYALQNNLAQVQPIDFSRPDTIGDQLAARLDIARGMKANYRAPMKLLTDQEAKQTSDMLKGLSPVTKTAALNALTSKIGDGEAVMELAGQLAPHDKTLGVGMLLASRGLQTQIAPGLIGRVLGEKPAPGRRVAEIYFNGVDALKNKTAKIDETKESGTRATIAKDLAGVYVTPEGTNLAMDAVFHVYAGLKAEGVDNLTQAENLVTGGMYEHNGGKITKPYGWSDSRFTDALAKVSADDLRRMGGGDTFRLGNHTLTAEELRLQLPGAKLQTLNDGVYAIQGGSGYVRGANGKPLQLNLDEGQATGFAANTSQVATTKPVDNLVTSRSKEVDRLHKQKKAP